MGTYCAHPIDATTTCSTIYLAETTKTWGNFRLAKVGRDWDAVGRAWACTGTLAASILAPHLTSVGTTDVYVDVDTVAGLEAAAAEGALQPIEGGRLNLRPFPTVTSKLLSDERQRLRLAPWPRVYADLQLIGVRGEEAAEHLRDVMHAR